ncbi:WD40 repeat-containing protein [Cavenderia fasciculata]|uniref:WD40 repeat-containing protein n=1 Tax=Cavenderia fasciculata TaxID=261658 RepID=F4PNR0_CACFS|nr:WD40 repeat-containing protein [Cavenderia fasciculata]EGG23113.1 WD40 repeat-containing protein [Cavenderia fasciculata]|eukprot:XP_004360964.1 WD40 repeat-containing protein [Cavenderia fasciculata]
MSSEQQELSTTTSTTSTTTNNGSGSDGTSQSSSSSSQRLIETKLKGHKDSVVTIALHKSQPLLASGSDDCTVRIWDTNKNTSIKYHLIYCAHGTMISSYDLRNTSIILKEKSTQYQFNNEEINQLAFDPKYLYLAACDDSGQTKIIDINKKKLYDTLAKKHTNVCSSVVFRPNSKNDLLTGSMDYSIIHWEYLKGKVLHRQSFGSASLLNPKKSSSDDQEEAKSNQILNPPMVNSIDITQDGRLVSAGIGNGNIVINEISSFRQHLLIEEAHTAPISQVHFPLFSQDILLSTASDSKLKFWDINNNNQKLENEDRVKLWTNYHSKINWMTSTKDSKLYIGDVSNDITLLTII